ncbi:hypothetical protein [Streptomyces wuyuanensis]|uniref:hypothetical protein n=1 Tax=Streptomyces wuyuanensis TaxID=1196353 RepID=UPI0036761200
MRVRIDSDGTSEDSPDAQAAAQLTADFANWLAQDRAVGPHVEIRRIRPESADGAMSGDLVAWLSLARRSNARLFRAETSTNATGTEPEPQEPDDSGESGEAEEGAERRSRADRLKQMGGKAATVVATGLVTAIGNEVVQQGLEWLAGWF